MERLPFASRSTVVGLGDSITDDWQSWIEILRALLSICRSNDDIRVVNAGFSGETTAQLFDRLFFKVVSEKPAWIICMAGTNDARRWGKTALKVEVSLEETEKNLAQLRYIGATETSAQWVWMTPTPVIPEMQRIHWVLGAETQPIVWMNEDLEPVMHLVRRQKGVVVDLQNVLGIPPNPEYLLDGLHPSLAGHKLIVRALVERLS